MAGWLLREASVAFLLMPSPGSCKSDNVVLAAALSSSNAGLIVSKLPAIAGARVRVEGEGKLCGKHDCPWLRQLEGGRTERRYGTW